MVASDLSPVVQRTLSDEAAEKLRASIRHGTLAPGARLVERQIAEQLGMSRIPVREAIQKLIEEGLVTKTPHYGTLVYVPSEKEIEEISSLRVVLERFVVERVIVRWSPQHEATLRDFVDKMCHAADENDFRQLFEHDYSFHNTLWHIADHSLLLETVSGLRSRINRFLYEAATALTASPLEIYLKSHNDLIETIKSGDIYRAQGEITRHILSSKQRILAYYATLGAGSEEKQQK
jgi:DNA-binding GntR family transcriptional regulator